MSQLQVNLRPSRDDDEPFIKALFWELETIRLGLEHATTEAREMFVNMQYSARQQHFQNMDVDQKECIIEVNGQPSGRCLVIQSNKEIRIADLELTRQFQGHGISGMIVASMQQESRTSDRPLRVVLAKDYPDLRAFYNYGFYQIDDLGHHLYLEWTSRGPTGGRIHISPAGV